MLSFVYIHNFELILDILDHLKPSIFSLKQPVRLAACYLEIVPLLTPPKQTFQHNLLKAIEFLRNENCSRM